MAGRQNKVEIVPSGYTSRLIGVFNAPEQVTPANMAALESGQAIGAMMYIQADLSSRPDNLNEAVAELSQMLKDAGVTSWLTEPAVPDPVYSCFYITWVNEGKGDVVANQWQLFLGSTLGKVLIGLLIAMFGFVLIPSFAELIETLMVFGMMMVMMYFMTQMLATVRPEVKPVAEKERELVERAKRGIPEAISEVKSLAERGVSWAKKALKEIKEE
jgi:hypothetical protein